jgi:hypothetical protein
MVDDRDVVRAEPPRQVLRLAVEPCMARELDKAHKWSLGRCVASKPSAPVRRVPAVWIVREFLRLAGRIAIAVLIAIVIAEVRAAISGGDTMRTFRIVLMLVGALLLLLAAGGQGGMSRRKMSHEGWWLTQSLGFGRMVAEGGPTLSSGAVFTGSGLVVLLLGVFL